jgi:uncharacterized protein with HEPN domain
LRHDHLYLTDIIEAADAVSRFLAGVTEQDFLASDLLQSAVLQKLMVIGEASARLSAEIKAGSPHVPWADIIGFRNIAAHAYFNVDWSIVWVAATEETPQLQAQILPLLDTEKDKADKNV